MAGAAQQGDRLNVFISYSRDDLAFADQLRAALLGYDFAVTIDRESITSGEDWKKRLGLLIRDADTIVFVLSPSSARSSTCAWEAKEAVSLGKRIVPILCRSLGTVKPPPELATLQYTYFYDEPKFPGSGFGTGLNSLRLALNTDPDWLREHTRYLRLAKEWEEVGKPSDRRLLSAHDIELAKKWIVDRPKNAPEPTSLQLEFIKASEAEDIRQRDAEAQRLRKVAEAERQAKEAAEEGHRQAAARAAAEAELRTTAEQKTLVERSAREEAEAPASRLRRALLAVGVGGIAALLGFGGFWYEFGQAQHQLDRANQALALSIINDLDLEPRESLTPRQREALWELAVAGRPVKTAFALILTKSPKET
ncbi:MAG TPA: TIR domain-containing protein, partial [Roseiarcus sp.]